MLFLKAEVSKKTLVEEKRFVAEEKLSVAVPQRVELMRHEGI
jgi:titin